MLQAGSVAETVLIICSVSLLGYLLGCINIKGIQLGSAGIFLVSLLFGHFGAQVPGQLQTFGLVMFVTSIGFSSGKGLLRQLSHNGLGYIFICLTTAAAGAVLCKLCIWLGGLDAPLAVGLMTGSFTSSPGFGAAKEAAGLNAARVAAGYGMAYPVGLICKVLLIQLIPYSLHADMEKERKLISPKAVPAGEQAPSKALLKPEKLGLFPFCLAILLGLFFGQLTLTLPGGGQLSFGLSGGALIMALLLSALGRLGPLDMRPAPSALSAFKEFGLMLFLACAGIEGGHGISAIIAEFGALPLLWAILLAVLPFLSGFLLFYYLLRIPLLAGLGSLSASMTSTPALVALSHMAETEDVEISYAATYPFALLILIFTIQLLML